MFEDADNFADLFRGGLPYYLLITLPILIICSSNPVLASSEFGVQRMSQFDVHGVSYGCRGSAINLEAKSLYTWSTSRHCIISRFQDLTIDQFREIRSKAGGLVIMFFENLANLSYEEKQQLYLLEQAMMVQEINIPVYFSQFNPELDQVIEDISKHRDNVKNVKRESALAEILNSISANGYQASITGGAHNANKASKIPIIQGELAPTKTVSNKNIDDSNKLPLIIVVAHLDTFGLINEHLSNLDAAVLLSLVDLFSKLYNSVNSSPKYRLMFLISESGAFLNFQGTKKWLDANLEENVQIQNPEFVLCLDSIGQSLDNNLFMHVSKPPKEGTSINNFYKQLKASGQMYGNVTVEGVHKKINLADVLLAWEHERFSMKRISAFTLSSMRSHKEPMRTTIFKESEEERIEMVQKTSKIIAESLARHIFGIADGEIFINSMDVRAETVKPWLNIKSTMLNNDLKNSFEKYLKNVKITYEKPDAREPDFMLYDGHDGTLNLYSVKPAVFDLFLTFLIASYLGVVYLAVLYFPHLYTIICKTSANASSHVNNTDRLKSY